MSILESTTPPQAASRESVLQRHVAGPRSTGWWGMVMLICTETMLFSALIASYFYLRYQLGPEWPPGGIEPPTLELPLIMTAILWSSSIPVHFAERAIMKGNQRRLRLGLALGFVLGATFLAMQLGLEYPETLAEFTPTTNSYGSMFYTITGFHGIHVLVGLLFSLWTQVRAWKGAFDAERHVTVQNFTMYWHFVDLVWLFVLSTVYLFPASSGL
ncbi:MAG: heme-copper oxidase subunit III [Actinobacteria bacterium]|nr:heme-copper oxidase subunit III [Actinomycetota bacterium]